MPLREPAGSPGAAPGRDPGHTADSATPSHGLAQSAIGAAAYALLAASPNAVVAVDRSGEITYANAQVEGAFGYSPTELVGQPLNVLLPERVRERHPMHRRGFFDNPIARPMGIGLDLAGRHRDGHEFPVEISLAPVETGSGLQVFATVVDITARKRAEAGLAESERRFRAVLEASPNAILAVDEAGLITYVNPMVGQTFGYASDELLGQQIERLLPERLGDHHISHRAAFAARPIARPIGIGMEVTGRRRDGTQFPVEIGLSPVETEAGPQVFATIVDISPRKAAEAELLQAQKLESVGRLAGGIAHDFNNILFAISGYAELLDQDLSPEWSATRDLESALASATAIGEAARRGASLTAQLLAFSRQQVMSAKVIELDAAVHTIEPMLRRLIGEPIRLVIRLDSGPGRIRIDPGQLDQILVNLVVNARDAMPDGGTLVIETGTMHVEDPLADGHIELAPGRYVMLGVTDTGFGMDERTRTHAFEPFFTTKERGTGTGLGLATSYGIVRQAGGHIWLYSEPGRGSVFKVYLPQVDEPATSIGPGEEALPPSSVGGTALVVEDEPQVRDVTTRLLERAGFEVIAVGGGDEALVMAERLAKPIDVLVTDAVMPGMSGVELADRIHELYPRAGIVVLSGYTAETLGLERIVARGARFVGKPVIGRALLTAVQAAITARDGGAATS